MPIITSLSLSCILIHFLKWERSSSLIMTHSLDITDGCSQGGRTHEGEDPGRPGSWPGSTTTNPPKLSRGSGSHMGIMPGIWNKFTHGSQIPEPLESLPINGPRTVHWTESKQGLGEWTKRKGLCCLKRSLPASGRSGQDEDKLQGQYCLLKADGEMGLKSQDN